MRPRELFEWSYDPYTWALSIAVDFRSGYACILVGPFGVSLNWRR